ncbi:sensor histidine kinase [Actinokineospora guangxiensis]|uniref:histidine kinase n=1 Tax=Actinokineospora guangxiensis TaxID=1490288 RepID=A0ABW0EUR7_9PSEU
MHAEPRAIRLDVLLAAVLTALTVITVDGHGDGRHGIAVHVLAALTVAPVALRQLAPVPVSAVVLGAMAAYGVAAGGEFPNAGVGALICVFTVATMRSRLVAGLVAGAAALVVVFVSLRLAPGVGWSEAVQAVLVVLGAWALGEGTRRWAERAQRMAERAARAAADERVRIARELHDVVAHHMAVISLQAGVARFVLDTDLATARQAIDTVGDTSREALAEMRRLLDVLRLDHDAVRAPQPGLAALGDLVERARGAGLRVEVAVTGQRRDLPSGPDLCAYRVAQEALTNVLKHAGPARARIDLEYGERTFALRVTDDGRGGPATAAPTSHGIRGMRERAELYGGALTAGPRPGGGFGVELRLPAGAA